MKFTARTGTALVGCLMVAGLVTMVAISQASTTAQSPQGPVPLPTTTAPQTPEIFTDNATPPPVLTVTETVDPPVVTTTETVTPAPPAPVTTTEIVTPPPALASASDTTEQPPPPVFNLARSDTEIREEVTGAFGVVNTYWTNLFAGWKDPQDQPVSWRVPLLLNGSGFYDSTYGSPFDACGTYLPDNASFCPRNGTISWDMALWRDVEQHGDGSIYAIVAHEVGHAAQQRFWLDGESLATPDINDGVRWEYQADCLSGAALIKAEQDGYLIVESGDLDEIIEFFMSLESQDGGDHGNAVDRLAAFNLGYNGSIESCLYNQGVSPASGVI